MLDQDKGSGFPLPFPLSVRPPQIGDASGFSRSKAILEQEAPRQAPPIKLGLEHRLELDLDHRDAVVDGVPLDLGAREYALLCAFVSFVRQKRRRSTSSIADLLRSFHVVDS